MRPSFLMIVATTAACSGSNDNERPPFDFTSIPDAPLSGVISGEPFEAADGITDPYFSNKDFYSSTIAGVSAACGETPSGRRLSFDLPTEPGEYELNLSRTVNFFDPDENTNTFASEGGLVLDYNAGNVLRGRMMASWDEDNEVAGTFDIEICD